MRQHYELMYIVPMKYAVEDLESIHQKVRDLIKKFNGEITSEEDMGKQKLAYPIKHVFQGFYYVMEFDGDRENLKQMERVLKLTDEILRFMIVVKRVKSKEEKIHEQKLKEKLSKDKEIKVQEEAVEVKKEIEEIQKKTVTEEKKATVKKDEKVSLEDLDKKLDEILEDNIL